VHLEEVATTRASTVNYRILVTGHLIYRILAVIYGTGSSGGLARSTPVCYFLHTLLCTSSILPSLGTIPSTRVL
jgi:hypothetical protein